MASLGDLVINIKVTGDREALAAIGRINQQAQQSSTAFRAGAASASVYFNTLNNGAFNATRSFMNMSGSVKVGNDNLSNLIQNLGALKILFEGIGKSSERFTTFMKGFSPKSGFLSGLKVGELNFQKEFDDLYKQLSSKKAGTLTQKDIFNLDFSARLSNAKNISDFAKIFEDVRQKLGNTTTGRLAQTTQELFQSMPKFENYKIKLLQFGEVQDKVVNRFLASQQKYLNAFKNITSFLQNNPAGMFLSSLITSTIKYYSILWKFVVPAFSAVAIAASQAAANMEKMKTQLQAILMGGGMGREAAMGRAGTMMTGFRAISEPSIFTSQQLFEASSRLEAFGINTFAKFGAKGEPVLKIMVKLAEVFGGMPDDLEMVVRMFGRMAAGDLPDIEVLSRFGISKADLNKAGGGNLINMTTGKLAGTPQQGVEALLNLINERYSELFELQKNNITSKIASLQEKFGELLVKIGEPINKALAPIIDNISKFMDQLIASGTAEMIGKAFADIIDIFSNPKVFESFKSLVINITSAVIQATMEFAKFTVVLMGISDMIVGIGKGFVAITKGDWAGAKAAGREISRGFSLAVDPMQGKGGKFGSAVQPWPMQMLNNFEQANALQKQLMNKGQVEDKKKALEELGKGPLLKRLLDGTEQQNSQLDTIAQNTGRAADALDLRKANMGGRGGALAQIGMGVNAGSDPVGITRAALPPSFALLNPVNQLQKSIQMEVFRTTNANYLRRY